MTPTPTPWHELPLATWTAGAPRREQSTPVRTAYHGEERRLLGRPAEGLHPLEDACGRIRQQAAALHARRDRQQRERERLALATADLYRRLEAQFGLYAAELCADLQGIGRDEVALRLEVAAHEMGMVG